MFVVYCDDREYEDDPNDLIAITDNEVTAQEMILSLTEEFMYLQFLRAIQFQGLATTEEIIKTFQKDKLIRFSWHMWYEEVPFIH